MEQRQRDEGGASNRNRAWHTAYADSLDGKLRYPSAQTKPRRVSDLRHFLARVLAMRLRGTATTLLLLTLLSACSGSDEPDVSEPLATISTTAAPTPSATAAPEDDLKTAIADYSTAYLTGDGATAHGLLSQRCQGVLPLSELASLTEQARDLYGDVKIESVDVDVDGDQATATYSYPVPAINQTDEPWLIEGTGWKNDDC